MKNSIEEDIILLKDFTEGNFKRDNLENYKGSYKIGYFYCKDIQQAIEHILSDYRRLLKENEILKKEKEQAWEEWNNLEQGSYETEQKLKQQIKESQRENEELKEKENKIYKGYAYIPAQKIKDIIDRINYDIKKTKEIISNDPKNNYQITRLKAMNTKSLDIKKRLQELLESEE